VEIKITFSRLWSLVKLLCVTWCHVRDYSHVISKSRESWGFPRHDREKREAQKEQPSWTLDVLLVLVARSSGTSTTSQLNMVSRVGFFSKYLTPSWWVKFSKHATEWIIFLMAAIFFLDYWSWRNATRGGHSV